MLVYLQKEIAKMFKKIDANEAKKVVGGTCFACGAPRGNSSKNRK